MNDKHVSFDIKCCRTRVDVLYECVHHVHDSPMALHDYRKAKNIIIRRHVLPSSGRFEEYPRKKKAGVNVQLSESGTSLQLRLQMSVQKMSFVEGYLWFLSF